MTGYYKEIELLCLDNDNYSAVGITSEMKKRGVNKEVCELLDNQVTSLKLVNFYEVGGAVEYGVEVVLECTLLNGKTVKTRENGIKYLNWVQEYKVENGTIEGDFLFIFQGTLAYLVERGSNEHNIFLTNYKNQEAEKSKSKNLEVKEGDIVNIYGRCIYLGEYYYYKPNLKNIGDFINKLNKYKLYIEIDKDGNYLDGCLHVESGKTKNNQVTEILGNVNFDMEKLKDLSSERMDVIFEKGIGYKEKQSWASPTAYSEKNNKAYVLTNISKTKDGLIKPDASYLLKLGWLCGWDIDKKYLFIKADRKLPYEYEVKY